MASVVNPDSAFQVTRVSQTSILIARMDGFSFLHGPEINNAAVASLRLRNFGRTPRASGQDRPSGSFDTLSVPELKAKDETVKPLEFKQYDSQWVGIKAADLTTGASAPRGKKSAPPDLRDGISVKANGRRLEALKAGGHERIGR